jgi:cytidylate kinase
MYRAITWVAIEEGIDPGDEKALERLAWETKIELVAPGEGDGDEPERVMVAGRDLSEDIKRQEVDRQVSLVAKHPGLRQALVSQQRELAAGGDVVMAGRDIGTVVLPCASLKVYLTASVEERARRRHLELQGLGHRAEYSSILEALKRRDKIDSQRKASPLRPAKDAQVVDTDGLGPAEVVDRILFLWQRARGQR